MSNYDQFDRISEAIRAELAPIIAENERLEESLQSVRQMMDYEDRSWMPILGGLHSGDKTEGLDLDEVKIISEKARTKVAAAALEKRITDLYIGHVLGQGVEIDGVVRDPNAEGRPPARVKFFEDPVNQEYLFSESGMKALQRARFTDGNIIAFCDTSNRTVRTIPLSQITGVLTNPEYADEVWAWKRSYEHHKTTGETETKHVWVYTNRFKGVKKESIGEGSNRVRVDKKIVAVDLRVNRQTGWLMGVPDATAGMLWTEAYGEVLQYGRIVSKSLADILYKVTAKKKDTAQNVGVKMGKSGPGGGVVLGEGQDIQLVSATQRSFDFTAARPLAAMAASAWGVSAVDLLADSSAAGSSYGAGSLLTPATQNFMRSMQSEWTRFFQDIFEVLGLGRPAISWEPMEEPDPYREAQALTLLSVALTDEEYRAEVLDILNIPGDPTDIPETLKQRGLQAVGSGAKQAASPDQGRSNGTNGADSGAKNDLRDDVQ